MLSSVVARTIERLPISIPGKYLTNILASRRKIYPIMCSRRDPSSHQGRKEKPNTISINNNLCVCVCVCVCVCAYVCTCVTKLKPTTNHNTIIQKSVFEISLVDFPNQIFTLFSLKVLSMFDSIIIIIYFYDYTLLKSYIAKLLRSCELNHVHDNDPHWLEYFENRRYDVQNKECKI